jgi:mutator family transposase
MGCQEYSTENATLARELLVRLRERGLEVTRPILCVIDGAKALRRAMLDIFDHPVIARCQQHKLRNVRDKLPERLRRPVEHRMRTSYHAASALDAEAQLLTLARELAKTHPGAAGSLREGLAQTLTVLRLGVPPTLARTLRSTDERFKGPVWHCRSAGTGLASSVGVVDPGVRAGSWAGSPAAQLADLTLAQLMGARLERAQLQRASLYHVHLGA